MRGEAEEEVERERGAVSGCDGERGSDGAGPEKEHRGRRGCNDLAMGRSATVRSAGLGGARTGAL